jgi:hypothetical protein
MPGNTPHLLFAAKDGEEASNLLSKQSSSDSNSSDLHSSNISRDSDPELVMESILGLASLGLLH